MVEYSEQDTVQLVDGPMDLVAEDGMYLNIIIEMVIKKERKKNRVNLYVKARLYAHAHDDDLMFPLYKKVDMHFTKKPNKRH